MSALPYAETYGNNFGRPADRRLDLGWGVPWRAALRIARREAWRHKGRSLLVILMIAIPVLGLTAADVIARSMQLTPVEAMTRSIGQADAGLIVTSRPVAGQVLDPVRLVQTAGLDVPSSTPEPGTRAYRRALTRIRSVLPAGTTFTTSAVFYANGTGHDRQVGGFAVHTLDLANPLTRGTATMVAGRSARTAGEVTVNHRLADDLRSGIGGTVTIAGRTLRIVGIVQLPDDLNDPAAVAKPGTFPVHPGDLPQVLLANTHGAAIDWPMVRRLNAAGAVVTGRAAVIHPPASGPEPVPVDAINRAREIGVGIVAVGLAILEVALLAGAAFAVGARRQTRDLALLGATGADARQLRSVVLAGGVVLGGLGAVGGVVGGIFVGRALLPEVAHLAGRLAGGFHLHPLELAGIAVVGLFTGVVAAALPARSAGRIDIVSALTGRRRQAATPLSVPVTGIVMAGVGAVLAAYAASPPSKFWLVLAGLVLGELGFVICAPAIVGAAARLARWTPLSMRLALRDAARHRGRTGPAVAAITAAVAGITAVSVYAASQGQLHRRQYEPQARIGQGELQFSSAKAAAAHLDAATTALRSIAGPKAQLLPVPTANRPHCTGCEVGVEVPDPATCQTGPACVGYISDFTTSLSVGDEPVLRTILGHPDPAAAAALAAGKAVVFARIDHPVAARTVTLDNALPDGRSRRIPAVFVSVGREQGALAGAVISPATARRLGYGAAVSHYAVAAPAPMSPDAERRINAALGRQHAGTQLYVERGYDPSGDNVALLALLAGALIVVLGTTGIVTGLSAAESKPDLATFAAVGAAPRTRRALAAAQASTVALLGTVTGVASGCISAFAILGTYGVAMPFTIPWSTIGAMALGLPLLAAVLIGLLTRARLPVERRWV